MIKCLFLVEGPYDLLRLSLLKGLFDENKLEIVPLAGDKLTTSGYFKKYEEVIRHFLNVESTYSYEDFEANGINLNFVKTNEITYKQYNNEFIPFLSIIDVMMFNSKEEVKQMLSEFTLINNETKERRLWKK